MSSTSIARQQRRFVFIALSGFALAAVGVCGFGFHIATRPYESGDFADVTWSEAGDPSVVVVTVRDANGDSVPDAQVHVDNNSGGRSETTNENGIATLKMGESDFSGLEINSVRVVDRPNAWRLGTPNTLNGLKVDVRLK